MTGSTLPTNDIVELPFDELMHQCKLALEADEKVWLVDFAQSLGPAAWEGFGVDASHPRFHFVTLEHISHLFAMWSASQVDVTGASDPPRIFGVINWRVAQGPWTDELSRFQAELRMYERTLASGRTHLHGYDVAEQIRRYKMVVAEEERVRDQRVQKRILEMYIRKTTTVVEVHHVDLRPKEAHL